MPDTYTVRQDDNLWKIAKKFNVSFAELKRINAHELALRQPPYGISAGDIIKLPPKREKEDLLDVCEKCKKCITIKLDKPFLIATAKDGTIVEKVSLAVDDDVLHLDTIALGQDITHGKGSVVPTKYGNIANEETVLKWEMTRLLDIFAEDDADGKARRLFDKFLAKESRITVFTDLALDKAVGTNKNFIAFSDRTLLAPGTLGAEAGKVRIHQALKSAGWDIHKVKPLMGLGVPAFNTGDKSAVPFMNSEDWSNGLAVMINGVQYVLVFVEKYEYDSCKLSYDIELKFVLYDVFGLDDEDVKRYGVNDRLDSAVIAKRGITAWWQLQHQFDYAPLLTRAVVYRSFTVSTAGQ